MPARTSQEKVRLGLGLRLGLRSRAIDDVRTFLILILILILILWAVLVINRSYEGGNMSSEATPFSGIERRVLGVLVEKAKTTPDAYPLSINAIVTGANQ